jgi:hypothetical protein
MEYCQEMRTSPILSTKFVLHCCQLWKADIQLALKFSKQISTLCSWESIEDEVKASYTNCYIVNELGTLT